MKKNTDNNNVYRHCVDKEKGDCPYMVRNQYGIATCSIDSIIQVEDFSCTPKEVLNKKGREE